MSDIHFRCFQDADWPDMVRFYDQFYRPGYIFSRREFFDWNFVAPPGSAGVSGQHLALDGDRIVGILGGYPWPLQIGGKREMGISLLNLYLDPAYRGMRLGHRLVEDYARVTGFFLGPGFNPRTLSMYNRLGLTHPWVMRRITRPLVADAVLGLLRQSPRYGELDPSCQGDTRDLICHLADQPIPSLELLFEPVERFDHTWDLAWEVIRASYGFTTWRSSEHLNWRYMDYPYRLYECLIARRLGEIVGFIALRLEEPTCGRILRVVDYVAVPGCRGGLLACALEWAKAHGAILVDLFGGGTLDSQLLTSLGYHELINPEGASLLPMDFNPIRCRASMQMLAFFLDRNDPRAREVAAGEYFFVKGDGDQDRAN